MGRMPKGKFIYCIGVSGGHINLLLCDGRSSSSICIEDREKLLRELRQAIAKVESSTPAGSKA
jgi:hypothetical protein